MCAFSIFDCKFRCKKVLPVGFEVLAIAAYWNSHFDDLVDVVVMSSLMQNIACVQL